jgi:hypothetical protein
MRYLIDEFLRPGARASQIGGSMFAEFTFDHVVSGMIEAQGEDPSDVWALVVDRNVVSTQAGRVVYDTPEPVRATPIRTTAVVGASAAEIDTTAEVRRVMEEGRQFMPPSERSVVVTDADRELLA